VDSFVQVMKALSDKNRVKIIKMLQVKPMCVCEIQALLHIAQPTVSKHLKILEASGLVTFRKEGLWVNYQLADGQKSPYASSVLGNLRHWLADDPSIKDIMDKSPSVSRDDIYGKPSGRPLKTPHSRKNQA
jgi:ArsR family transcriptional regulator